MNQLSTVQKQARNWKEKIEDKIKEVTSVNRS